MRLSSAFAPIMSSAPATTSVHTNPLITETRQLLLDLSVKHWPDLPNPPNCKKRASVACLIRIRPRYPDVSTPPPLPQPLDTTSPQDESFASQIEAFFSLSWVQRGTPEILFIKRAARHGDRWTSHVALPGGKRDPNDASDIAAAIRETVEEVGIDLSSTFAPPEHPESSIAPDPAANSAHPDPHGHGPEPPIVTEDQDTPNASSKPQTFPPALLAGPLPQRIITTDFGAIPLMVLCPIVFLLTSPEPTSQALRLQPTEVGSAHWVPIRSLLDPGARTYERADLVDRLAVRWGLGWGGGLARWGLRMTLGRMLYSAIRLAPSESLFACDDADAETFSDPESAPLQRGSGPWNGEREKQERCLRKLWRFFLDDAPWVRRIFTGTQDGDSPDPRRSLLLWGLTQGIISDLLGLMPSRRDFTWWHWPTLSRPDIRLVTWIVSYRFRKRKLQSLRRSIEAQGKVEGGSAQRPVLIEEGIGAVPKDNAEEMVGKTDEEQEKSNSKEEIDRDREVKARATVFSAAGYVLDGYFEQIQRAIFITVALRALVGSVAALYFWRRFIRRT